MGGWPDPRRSVAMGGETFSCLDGVTGVGVVADGLVGDVLLELEVFSMSAS